ncbi:hypothetical protein CFAM422_004881 [Trichoderma lentiforme]|uniref:Rhodopsin domain-containing protein n=1 Tax=Trichoderma lentiforme TaxID=1567552 RepID=A0A9P5CD02_9HYPO|nr:hypothetical protein CFAM422_004881 [Trichoderma lentiforme]
MADVGGDKGPLCLAVIIATLAVGGILVFTRVLTRTVIRPHFGWDDGLIVITWFIILGYNVCMFVSIQRGYGRRSEALTETQITSAIKAEVIGQFFAIASFPSGKASIAYLLQRIFPGKKLQWFLWSFVAANAICFYVDSVLILVQCQPVAFQWDHTIPGGKCWDSRVVVDWGFLTGTIGALTDFCFAVLPWFYLRKLQMGLKEKITIGVALSMGFFATVCSSLKIYYTWTLGSHQDFTYDTVPLVIWSCVELASINVAACIPTLGPLYLWLVGSSSKSTKAVSDYESKHGTGSGKFGRLANRNSRGIELESLDDRAFNIYQSKSYRVSFEDRDDKPIKVTGTAQTTETTQTIQTEADVGATITVQRAYAY